MVMVGSEDVSFGYPPLNKKLWMLGVRTDTKTSEKAMKLRLGFVYAYSPVSDSKGEKCLITLRPGERERLILAYIANHSLISLHLRIIYEIGLCLRKEIGSNFMLIAVEGICFSEEGEKSEVEIIKALTMDEFLFHRKKLLIKDKLSPQYLGT